MIYLIISGATIDFALEIQIQKRKKALHFVSKCTRCNEKHKSKFNKNNPY